MMFAQLVQRGETQEEPTYPILDHDALVRRHFTAALAAGHYRGLEPRPWRDQVW